MTQSGIYQIQDKKVCNRAKGDSSVEEFLEWSKRLYERQIS